MSNHGKVLLAKPLLQIVQHSNCISRRDGRTKRIILAMSSSLWMSSSHMVSSWTIAPCSTHRAPLWSFCESILCDFLNEVWPSVISCHLVCKSWLSQLLGFVGKIEAKKVGLMKQPTFMNLKKYIACQKFMHLLSRNWKWYRMVCSLLSWTPLQQKAHFAEDILSEFSVLLPTYLWLFV